KPPPTTTTRCLGPLSVTLAAMCSLHSAREALDRSAIDPLGLLGDRRAGVIGEPIENARCEQPLARGLRLLERLEHDLDEHLAGVVGAAEQAMPDGRPAGLRSVLIEHRLP